MIKPVHTRYGVNSMLCLETVTPNLQMVANRALRKANLIGRDISIVTGHRPEEEQLQKFEQGLSKVKKGKHNTLPSMALDFTPFDFKYGALTGHSSQIKAIAADLGTSYEAAQLRIAMEYGILAGCFLAASYEVCVPIRCGIDWDSDGSVLDTNFLDMGHIEEAS